VLQVGKHLLPAFLELLRAADLASCLAASLRARLACKGGRGQTTTATSVAVRSEPALSRRDAALV
jgi:hypothetical protein